MSREPGARPDLERGLLRLWRRRGYEVDRVEVGEVPVPRLGTVLCANFLPAAGAVGDDRASEEMVRILLVFLVVKGHCRRHAGVQSAVNFTDETGTHGNIFVARKYWIDQDRLRELERLGHRRVRALPLDRMISGSVPE